jgi:hypothetical protein
MRSGRPCNVDRLAGDFNVLGARSCNFRRERREGGLNVAADGPGLDGPREAGMAKRLRRAREVQSGVALGRVERPFGERLVAFAPDCVEADLHRSRDLPLQTTTTALKLVSRPSTRFALCASPRPAPRRAGKGM